MCYLILLQNQIYDVVKKYFFSPNSLIEISFRFFFLLQRYVGLSKSAMHFVLFR